MFSLFSIGSVLVSWLVIFSSSSSIGTTAVSVEVKKGVEKGFWLRGGVPEFEGSTPFNWERLNTGLVRFWLFRKDGLSVKICGLENCWFNLTGLKLMRFSSFFTSRKGLLFFRSFAFSEVGELEARVSRQIKEAHTIQEIL